MKFKINQKNEGITIKLVDSNKIDTDFLMLLKNNNIFKGLKNEIYFDVINNVIYLGIGEEEKLNYYDLKIIFYNLGQTLQKNKIKSISFDLYKINNLCTYRLALALSSGLLHSTYVFENYKSNKNDVVDTEINFNVVENKVNKLQEAIKEAENIVSGIFLAKNLVNEPANTIYPETLANIAKNELEPLGVKVTIYGKKEIEEIGMSAFLSVARASEKEPKFIVMEYLNNPESEEKIALIGKGVTYDSGGLAIKPASSMVDMFTDMGGSATVIGAMKSIALNNLKTNVIALVASCENMISGNSYRNGDIINSLSGKTIEIINTDAEGRLTLADAIYYATSNLKVNKVIDLATLTGACYSSFGERVSAVVTNNDEFYQDLENAAKISNEYIWKMPNISYYKNMNDSSVADIKNAGGKFGGIMTAGLFVGSFLADENIPWIHIDIAGTAYINTPYDHYNKGGTGVLVETLYNLFK